MSGDSERDAPYQHPTERENYEAFLRSKNIDPLAGKSLTWDLWQAASELKQKEIEQLKARLFEMQNAAIELERELREEGAGYEEEAAWQSWQAASELKQKEIEQLKNELSIMCNSFDQLGFLLTEKDKEVDNLKTKLSEFQTSEFNPDWSMLQASHESLREHMTMINELKAKLAMCVEALQVGDMFAEGRSVVIAEALSATEQDVSKWRREVEAKAIEECADWIESSPLQQAFWFRDVLLELAQQKRSEE